MYQICTRYITTGVIIFGKKFNSVELAMQAVSELNAIYDKNKFPMYATYLKVQ